VPVPVPAPVFVPPVTVPSVPGPVVAVIPETQGSGYPTVLNPITEFPNLLCFPRLKLNPYAQLKS